VSLTYQFDNKQLAKMSALKGFSVTAALANFWLIYADNKLEGQDPEFFNSGGVAQPMQKQVTLSLKVSL